MRRIFDSFLSFFSQFYLCTVSVRTGSCIMTVTGQEIVQDIETVSGTGLYTVVTNRVNLSPLSLLSFYVAPPLLFHPFLFLFHSLIPLSHICCQYTSHPHFLPYLSPILHLQHHTTFRSLLLSTAL